jgi:hypothetical protein
MAIAFSVEPEQLAADFADRRGSKRTRDFEPDLLNSIFLIRVLSAANPAAAVIANH